MKQHLSIPPDKGVSDPTPEKFIPLGKAAQALGLPPWKLRRTAKQGLFPTYRLLNDRLLVKLSEVMAAIEASRQGGSI